MNLYKSQKIKEQEDDLEDNLYKAFDVKCYSPITSLSTTLLRKKDEDRDEEDENNIKCLNDSRKLIDKIINDDEY